MLRFGCWFFGLCCFAGCFFLLAPATGSWRGVLLQVFQLVVIFAGVSASSWCSGLALLTCALAVVQFYFSHVFP